MENVRVQNKRDTGLFLGGGGFASQVENQGNFRRDMQVTTARHVKNSNIRNNGNSASSVALSPGPGGTLNDNMARKNSGTGITSSLGNTVRGNTVLDTYGFGMSVLCRRTVVENTATSNSGGNLDLIGNSWASANNTAP